MAPNAADHERAERIGEEFLRLTRYGLAGPADQQLGAPQPPLHRRHPLAGDALPLPTVDTLSAYPVDCRTLVTDRYSVREYAAEPLELAELSWLLWATQGVKGVYGNGYCTLRTVPSAGARHPFETYLVVNRVDRLAEGLYQYLPLEHAVAALPASEGIARQLAAACLGQRLPVDCAVAFVWSAVPYRTTWRYGQRGYRYLHLDAGHVGQNLYLAAEACGCGCCTIAAFEDETVGRLFRLDPAEEFVIYMATVGRRQATAD